MKEHETLIKINRLQVKIEAMKAANEAQYFQNLPPRFGYSQFMEQALKFDTILEQSKFENNG